MEVNTEKLLNLIKARSPLYNLQDQQYSNRYAVEQLWIEIAIEMGCDVTDCKKKWASLRNAYARYLRQERDGQLKKKWHLADNLSFLREHIQLHPVNKKSLHNYNPLESKFHHDSWSDLNENTQNNSSTSSARNSPIPSEKSVNIVSKFEEEEEEEDEEEQVMEYVEPTPIEKPAAKKRRILAPEVREEAGIEYVQRGLRVKPRENGNALFFKCLLLDYERLSTKRQRTFRLYMLNKMNELQEDEENEVLNASTASAAEAMLNFKLQ